MDATKIKAALVVIIAAFAALYLGISAATAQLETIAWVMGGLVISVCVFLGRRIWMILPFMNALWLTLMIPGTPTTIILAHLLFVGFSCLLILMRRLPFRVQITEMEMWMLVLGLCILQAYVRNPVGLNILGGSEVGGRPYVLFLLTLCSCLLFGSLIVREQDLKSIYRLIVAGYFLNFVLSAVGFFLPQFGQWIGAGRTGRSTSVESASSSEMQASRVGFMGLAGRNLSLWICSRISPLRGCLSPLWMPLLLLSLVFSGLSGYRSEVIILGLTYMVGLFYRGGGTALVASCFAGVMALALIAFVNLAIPLPANIQRSLAFLPGTWNESLVRETDDSTTWRVEMWKEALLTDFWIENKILGDGLGFSRQELIWMKNMQETSSVGGAVGSGKLTRAQEFMMVSGSYHSGPVSTIRVIGYVGLVVFLIAQIRLAVHAHRLIIRCRNTEWYPLALLLGIRAIYLPFYYVFVFGNFGEDLSIFIVNAALIVLLEKNLPLPALEKQPHVPLTSRRNIATARPSSV